MRSRILFLILFLLSENANALFFPSVLLSEILDKSQNIVVVRIQSGKLELLDDKIATCPFLGYVATVKQVIKGDIDQESIEFSSSSMLKVGADYLVFLREKPTMVLSKENLSSPYPYQSSKDRLSCIKRLPVYSASTHTLQVLNNKFVMLDQVNTLIYTDQTFDVAVLECTDSSDKRAVKRCNSVLRYSYVKLADILEFVNAGE